MKNIKTVEYEPGKIVKTGDSVPDKIVDESKIVRIQAYQKHYLPAGEYLQQAGNCYLGGVGLTIIGSGFSVYESTKTYPDNNKVISGGIIAAVGLVCTVVGHLKLIKAGVALDEERKISLQPSSSGIGLALKF